MGDQCEFDLDQAETEVEALAYATQAFAEWAKNEYAGCWSKRQRAGIVVAIELLEESPLDGSKMIEVT
jgi:hypothetical protein